MICYTFPQKPIKYWFIICLQVDSSCTLVYQNFGNSRLATGYEPTVLVCSTAGWDPIALHKFVIWLGLILY